MEGTSRIMTAAEMIQDLRAKKEAEGGIALELEDMISLAQAIDQELFLLRDRMVELVDYTAKLDAVAGAHSHDCQGRPLVPVEYQGPKLGSGRNGPRMRGAGSALSALYVGLTTKGRHSESEGE
uniref:Uncharacterized protein n=1 Tax=viral metagenome TaxID=1070528 RepID=A0A6M3KMD7_9ZZZZ